MKLLSNACFLAGISPRDSFFMAEKPFFPLVPKKGIPYNESIAALPQHVLI